MLKYRRIVLSFFVFHIVLLGNHQIVAAQAFQFKSLSEEAYQVLVQFYQYDRHFPPNARVVQTTDMENCTREKVVFTGSRDSRVPGYLAIPKTGTAPYPCVLLLHGLTGNKAEWWDEDNYISGGLVSKQLLAAGFAVLALDAQYHGERSMNNDYEPTNIMTFERRYYNRYREMEVETVVDYRKAIDYLETRSEIDSDKIGVIGYSMGGNMTFVLTAVEPRIKSAVACVTPVTKCQLCGDSAHNFAKEIGNRPFLMLMGRSDQFYSEDDAQQLYNLISGPIKELVFYDTGHQLPQEYTTKAANWHTEHLK